MSEWGIAIANSVGISVCRSHWIDNIFGFWALCKNKRSQRTDWIGLDWMQYNQSSQISKWMPFFFSSSLFHITFSLTVCMCICVATYQHCETKRHQR